MNPLRLGDSVVKAALRWAMEAREQEYRWYVTGCNRLGQEPLDESAFAAHWQELEDHAEMLKAADTNKTLADLDAKQRADMENKVKDDPFVKAVLIGMAEEGVQF